MNEKDIPKALANDNFIGYIRKYFLQHNVTWLEATIACPLFSGLVTYYIEGERSDRHHLMQADLASDWTIVPIARHGRDANEHNAYP